MATVVISASAQQQFSRLPRAIQIRLERVFARLERWPEISGVKTLTGKLAGSHRLRTGDYRIQFHVVASRSPSSADRIVVDKVGHRDGFYED